MVRVSAPPGAAQLVKYCFVQISDDSLLGLGIKRHDVLRFDLTKTFANGALALVTTPDGTFPTLIYQIDDERYGLEAAHPDYPPLVYQIEEVIIHGVV